MREGQGMVNAAGLNDDDTLPRKLVYQFRNGHLHRRKRFDHPCLAGLVCET